jgi:hypothetical protein
MGQMLRPVFLFEGFMGRPMRRRQNTVKIDPKELNEMTD